MLHMRVYAHACTCDAREVYYIYLFYNLLAFDSCTSSSFSARCLFTYLQIKCGSTHLAKWLQQHSASPCQYQSLFGMFVACSSFLLSSWAFLHACAAAFIPDSLVQTWSLFDTLLVYYFVSMVTALALVCCLLLLGVHCTTFHAGHTTAVEYLSRLVTGKSYGPLRVSFHTVA